MKPKLIFALVISLGAAFASSAFVGKEHKATVPLVIEQSPPVTQRPGVVTENDISWYVKNGAADLGEVMGDALDIKRNLPVQGIEIDLFLADGTPVGTTTTDTDGKFNFPNLALGDYRLLVDDPNFRPLDMYFTVSSAQLTQLPPVWCVPEPVLFYGDINGSVIDVLTGQQIDGVSLEFRKGINPPLTEPVVFTAQTTGSMGNFYYQGAGLEAGVYTAFASKPSYRDGTFHVYVLGAETVAPQNGVLSPTIQGDDMRIILTWGLIPADLDSHLWAPDPFGSGKVHLYFELIPPRGSNPWGAYFSLDLDDVDSYGPETTSIYQWEPDTYCFFVHDYTFQFCPICKFLSNSGARVVVLTATDTYVFYPTRNTMGTVWGVFTVDGATREVTSLNTYSFQPVIELVGSSCVGM